MLCQECQKKNAVVHLTEIVNEETTEYHLCQECAQKKEGYDMFEPLSINDILASFLNADKSGVLTEKRDARKCKSCGIDYNDFKKSGRLGCGYCYISFRPQLLSVIKRVQGGIQHSGKITRRIAGNVRVQKKIEQLRERLRKAIEAEEYEQAAGLRDEIRNAEQQLKTEN